jgi:DNA-binding MarR family transcriptional regulator
MAKHTEAKNKNESLGFLIWQLSNFWQRNVNSLFLKHNLTHAQYAVLDAINSLSVNSKNIAQSKICEFAGTDKMMTSKIISSLQEKKFTKRLENKEDLRSNSILITDQGKTVCLKAKSELKIFEAKFFSILDKKEKGFHKKVEAIITANTTK